jgi:hypothetical protein
MFDHGSSQLANGEGKVRASGSESSGNPAEETDAGWFKGGWVVMVSFSCSV